LVAVAVAVVSAAASTAVEVVVVSRLAAGTLTAGKIVSGANSVVPARGFGTIDQVQLPSLGKTTS
jgi:hypothetical protein